MDLLIHFHIQFMLPANMIAEGGVRKDAQADGASDLAAVVQMTGPLRLASLVIVIRQEAGGAIHLYLQLVHFSQMGSGKYEGYLLYTMKDQN